MSLSDDVKRVQGRSK